jgi:hypothetical protein
MLELVLEKQKIVKRVDYVGTLKSNKKKHIYSTTGAQELYS